ncbi:hypothetical protein ONZ45_g14073 [Pleurotus djamor]|nr:hypothetical protein ONZ45_g14073 [Pleurotus djamor]
MPHEHHHGCGHESHDHDHDHDHDQNDLGPQDSLFGQIDRDNLVALNGNGNASDVIKPWHERLDETKFLRSEDDDQLIVRIPFLSGVKVRSLLIKAGPSEHTPSKVSMYTDNSVLSFDDVSDKDPVQEIDLVQTREVAEYPLRTAKFSNISSVTLFFPASQGAENIQLYYIGFLGTWTQHKGAPVVTVYEAQANPADHEKIQGMGGVTSAPQF